MLNVFFQTGAINKDIVKEDDNTLTKQRFEGAIHGALKCIWCPRQPKCHHSELKVALVRLKCSFMLLPRRQPDLIEPYPKVQAGEPSC